MRRIWFFFVLFMFPTFSWTSQRTRRVLSRGGLILWKTHKKKGVFVFLNPFLSPSGISEKKFVYSYCIAIVLIVIVTLFEAG